VTAAADLFIGLISGTSADAIDAALVRFAPQPTLLATANLAYPATLRREILALALSDGSSSLAQVGRLDVEIGGCFAEAANHLLAQAGVDRTRIRAIGSHGQTLWHAVQGATPFTLQLGDPNVIAERTGLLTVADFRRRDVAAGGQGAPLVPAFHAACLHDPQAARAVLNLGGIGNLTLLPSDGPVRGFDTGPANTLLDAWAERHLGTALDDGGAFAASGRCDTGLLQRCLQDPYFARSGPKSCGRDTFNLVWLDRHLRGLKLSAADVQATLIEVTARSIAIALRRAAPATSKVFACGGGVHNPTLLGALATALQPIPLASTADAGIDPDFIEAMAFAWLARERLQDRPGNLTTVTGARGPRVLGAIYAA